MSKSQYVKNWRKRTKQRMVDAMGGECVICGYKKSTASLIFHHLNSDEKGFSIGGTRANIKSWSKLIDELKKCVLLCSNCHGELHEGSTQLPETFHRFDERYETYEWQKPLAKNKTYNNCPVCNNSKLVRYKYCSQECSHFDTRRAKRPTREELIGLLKKHTWVALGRMFNVSDNAVRKWARNYKIEYKKLKIL